jgi:predicted DNA-binding WGR domain protein
MGGAVAMAAGLDPQMAALKKDLGLSDQQAQDWDKINKEARQIMQEHKKAILEANKQKKAKIDALLTAEQKKKYQDMLNPPMPAESQPPQMAPMEAPAEQPAGK